MTILSLLKPVASLQTRYFTFSLEAGWGGGGEEKILLVTVDTELRPATFLIKVLFVPSLICQPVKFKP